MLFAPTEQEARWLFRSLLADRGRYEGLGRRDVLGSSGEILQGSVRPEGLAFESWAGSERHARRSSSLSCPHGHRRSAVCPAHGGVLIAQSALQMFAPESAAEHVGRGCHVRASCLSPSS